MEDMKERYRALLDARAHPRLEVAELAEVLGMSLNGAYYACRRGDIPGVRRVGKRWLIPTASVRRMLMLDDEQVAS